MVTIFILELHKSNTFDGLFFPYKTSRNKIMLSKVFFIDVKQLQTCATFSITYEIFYTTLKLKRL